MNKILYIIEADLKSGAGLCAIELLKRVKEFSNYKPIVVTQYANNINDWCNNHDIENYNIHYARTCNLGMSIWGWLIAFFMRPILNFYAYFSLKKHLNYKDISIIHTNAVSIDFGAYLHRKIKKPHIWHIRDFMLFCDKWGQHPLIRKLPKYIERNSTKILTVSKELRNYLVDYPISNDKVQCIYDGISIPSVKDQKNNWISSNTLKVVCIGTLCELKGQKTLIQAICRIPAEIRNHFHFDFYGHSDPSYMQDILETIKQNNANNVISFHPFISDVFSILKNYDIGIQPSHSEGFSRVTAEYMAAGLCVIAANEGAIPELIKHNENGFLYEDYNEQGLANILISCLRHPENIQRTAIAAQEKALNDYNIDKNFSKITAIYDEVLRKQC